MTSSPLAGVPVSPLWPRSRWIMSLCMIFASGSSGRRFIRSVPRESSQGLVFAIAIHSGCCPFSMKKFRNSTAMITRSNPRAAPNAKPRVRSSGPARESSTKSEMRMVMIETSSSVMKKSPPMVMPSAMFLSST
jgi:hypothetical protein